MRICQSCKKEISSDLFIGRQAQCPFCTTDLHVCLNCVFYEPGAYNDCREGQAERVLDKSRSNFCDFFKFRTDEGKNTTLAANSREKFDALFKK